MDKKRRGAEKNKRGKKGGKKRKGKKEKWRRLLYPLG